MKKAVMLLMCVMACGRVATGEGYDYFRNIRYLAKWRDKTLEGKPQFKAHLLGFSGNQVRGKTFRKGLLTEHAVSATIISV